MSSDKYSDGSRAYLTHHTDDVVLAFASRCVALDTIASALVIARDRVERICLKGVETGVIQRMPPTTTPTLSAAERRDAMVTELVHARETIIDLQDTIRYLTKSKDDLSEKLWRTFGLTRSECAMLVALVQHESCSKTRLYLALYGEDTDQGAEPKIIDVFICKMRRKLRKHGVAIETIWGSGYRLSPDNVAKLRDLIGDTTPTVVSPPLQATETELVA